MNCSVYKSSKARLLLIGVNGMYNSIRYTCEFDADESEMINRWLADKPDHVSRSEMLRIVDFYVAIVGPDFQDVCEEIRYKISIMSNEEWNECANRIPFEVPYTADAIIENLSDEIIYNLLA